MQMVIILNAQVVSEINVLLHMSIMWNNNFQPPVLLLLMSMNIIGKHSMWLLTKLCLTLFKS